MDLVASSLDLPDKADFIANRSGGVGPLIEVPAMQAVGRLVFDNADRERFRIHRCRRLSIALLR